MASVLFAFSAITATPSFKSHLNPKVRYHTLQQPTNAFIPVAHALHVQNHIELMLQHEFVLGQLRSDRLSGTVPVFLLRSIVSPQTTKPSCWNTSIVSLGRLIGVAAFRDRENAQPTYPERG